MLYGYNRKIYKTIATLPDVAGKSISEQARKGIDAGIDSFNSGKYETAKQQFEGVVQNIVSTQIIDKVRNNYRGEHKNYVATAAFGQGLAEGILGKESVVRSPHNLEYFAKIAYKFYQASNHKWSYEPAVHRKIGRGYGSLGLTEEGLKILDFGRMQSIFHGYCSKLER